MESEGNPQVKAVRLSAWCDGATELLIYFLIVFTPWAFGTTQTWSIRLANKAGYALGLLLILKWIIRWVGTARGEASVPREEVRWTTVLVAGLNAALLAYVLTSLLNARATFDYRTNLLTYHSFLSWLPHTYDSKSTWPAFWNYLAWTAVFWAVRDWLLSGREKDTMGSERSNPRGTDPSDSLADANSPSILRRSKQAVYRPPFPPRLQRLFWVISINGALLAIEGMAQRATDTNKLLWFQETIYNRFAEAQFGPFAYRANGAQYINLVWPLTLGFWWAIQRMNSRGRQTIHHVLLSFVVLMIVAPVVSLSRAGAIVTALAVAGCGAVFVMHRLEFRSIVPRIGLLVLLGAAFAGAVTLGGPQLFGRMRELGAGLAGREHTYELASRMAKEYPVFGTGAETFQPLFQFFKGAPDEFWPGQVHNDWLETRITFGWVGFGMILCALAATIAHWFGPSAIRVSWRFVSFLWIAMAGCLLHARWDFPFQVYSIALLFLIYCAVLLGMGLRAKG